MKSTYAPLSTPLEKLCKSGITWPRLPAHPATDEEQWPETRSVTTPCLKCFQLIAAKDNDDNIDNAMDINGHIKYVLNVLHCYALLHAGNILSHSSLHYTSTGLVRVPAVVVFEFAVSNFKDTSGKLPKEEAVMAHHQCSSLLCHVNGAGIEDNCINSQVSGHIFTIIYASHICHE